MKKEYSETKTYVSPDGKTKTTMTVNSSSEITEHSINVSTSLITTTTSTSITASIVSRNEEK